MPVLLLLPMAVAVLLPVGLLELLGRDLNGRQPDDVITGVGRWGWVGGDWGACDGGGKAGRQVGVGA